MSSKQNFPFKVWQVLREKHSKIRITGVAAAIAVGEKLPMFVIGKSKNPRCFNNVKSLPCRCRSQQESRMGSALFEKWVRALDRNFFNENWKIALIIDNWPAHPTIGNLSNVRLIFLPPNTTSVSQPMDQVVIKCLKTNYRRRLVRDNNMLGSGKRFTKDFNSWSTTVICSFME